MVNYKCEARKTRTRTRIYALAKMAEERGIINPPERCEKCDQKKKLIKHHCDYKRPLFVAWVCKSCHRKIHKGKNRKGGLLWERSGVQEKTAEARSFILEYGRRIGRVALVESSSNYQQSFQIERLKRTTKAVNKLLKNMRTEALAAKVNVSNGAIFSWKSSKRAAKYNTLLFLERLAKVK